MEHQIGGTGGKHIHGRMKISLEIAQMCFPKGSLLDVGCANGLFQKEIGLKESVGVDIEKEKLKRAIKNVSHGHFLLADARYLPFKNEVFDVVSFWEVLEHLPKGSEKSTIKEINRVLKIEGSLLLSTPHKSFWGRLDAGWWFLGHRHYSIENIYSLLDGFDVKKIDIWGSLWFLTHLYLHDTKYSLFSLFRCSSPFLSITVKKLDEELENPKKNGCLLGLWAIKRNGNRAR